MNPSAWLPRRGELLGFSAVGFGCTSRRTDTVSGARIGVALATLVRFWGTRTLVFGVTRREEGKVGSWTG